MYDYDEEIETWLWERREEAYQAYLMNCVDNPPLNFEEWLDSSN